jgi:hypothetical protein
VISVRVYSLAYENQNIVNFLVICDNIFCFNMKMNKQTHYNIEENITGTEREIPETRRRQSSQCTSMCTGICRAIRVIGEDWFFLAALGIIMAILSWSIDKCIETLKEGK